jgi:hypothetical protein
MKPMALTWPLGNVCSALESVVLVVLDEDEVDDELEDVTMTAEVLVAPAVATVVEGASDDEVLLEFVAPVVEEVDPPHPTARSKAAEVKRTSRRTRTRLVGDLIGPPLCRAHVLTPP